jgi:hypothetical protein
MWGPWGRARKETHIALNLCRTRDQRTLERRMKTLIKARLAKAFGSTNA